MKVLIWQNIDLINWSLSWRHLFNLLKWIDISTTEVNSYIHSTSLNLANGFPFGATKVCIAYLWLNTSFNIFSCLSHQNSEHYTTSLNSVTKLFNKPWNSLWLRHLELMKLTTGTMTVIRLAAFRDKGSLGGLNNDTAEHSYFQIYVLHFALTQLTAPISLPLQGPHQLLHPIGSSNSRWVSSRFHLQPPVKHWLLWCFKWDESSHFFIILKPFISPKYKDH